MGKVELRPILHRAVNAGVVRAVKREDGAIELRPSATALVPDRLAVLDLTTGGWASAYESGSGWFSLARFLGLDLGEASRMVEP